MKGMDGLGRRTGEKKRVQKSSWGRKNEKTGRIRRTPTHAVPTPSPPPPFSSSLVNENEREEWTTTGSQQLRSRFISHSSVLSFPIHSFYPSSLPLSFMLLLIIAQTSLPLSISLTVSPLMVLAFTPHVSAWTEPGVYPFQMDRL